MNMFIIAFSVVLLAGGIYFALPTQAAPASTVCVNSVVNLRPYLTACSVASSQLDSMLYTSGPAPVTGAWGGTAGSPSQVQPGGFIKVYYFLAIGASLTSYNIAYSSPGGFVQLPGVIYGSDGNLWFGAWVPSNAFSAMNVPVDFRATLTDSFGTTSTVDAYFMAVQALYPVTFLITDGSNPASPVGLQGVQIVITPNGGSTVLAQLFTNSVGGAVFSLPYGSYVANFYPPSGYLPLQSITFNAQDSPSIGETAYKLVTSLSTTVSALGSITSIVTVTTATVSGATSVTSIVTTISASQGNTQQPATSNNFAAAGILLGFGLVGLIMGVVTGSRRGGR